MTTTRRFAALAALVLGLAACGYPRGHHDTTTTTEPEVQVQICPPLCGDDPPPTTTWWTYDPTPPPGACIGHDADGDAIVTFPPNCDS